MKPYKGMEFEMEWMHEGDFERGVVDRIRHERIFVSFPDLPGHHMNINEISWKKMVDREEIIFPGYHIIER